MLAWSIRLFRIRGIQLSLHFTFLLFLAFIGWYAWRESPPGARLLGVVANIGFMLIFFLCVVLHELGHAFMARRFGVRVPRILLLPIGGMAEFDQMPRSPRAEVAIALAGPAVNAAIIALLLLFVPFPSWNEVKSLELSLWQWPLVMNLGMGLFNLTPAFPMDGGRVLRAALATRLPYLRATFWAATIGKLIGFVAAIAFLTSGKYFGAAAAVFIIVVGELEYRVIRRQEQEEEHWRRWAARFYAQTEDPPRAA
jgi:Zn-dependent protease